MKKKMGIFVSLMILCVMMDGLVLGEIESFNLESGRYGENWNRKWRIHRPGAERIRVHFDWIRTERKYDWVKTSAGDSWTGTYYHVWSTWEYGDTMVITLTSDESINADGFRIDKIDVEMHNSSINIPHSSNTSPTNSTSVPQHIIPQYRGIRSGSYDNYSHKEWEIYQPDAKRIRVHFAWIRTERIWDWVKTSASFWDQWTGHHDDVWSRWEYGDTIVVTLTSDGSVIDEGFYIDYIEYEV